MVYPDIKKKFKLTLTEDQLDPYALIKKVGFNCPGWSYKGEIPKILTIECMLVQIGSCSNCNEAKEKLEKLGGIPSGLFIHSFKVQYPKTDYADHIGIAEPLWFYPQGNLILFPAIHSCGNIQFHMAHQNMEGSRRWIITV